MPFGEYLPALYQGLARLMGQGAIIDQIEGVRDFHIREQSLTPTLLDGIPSIAMLCSEAMSPYLYADGARHGAEVFFNLASHSWFHGSRTLYALALWTGRVRAVESHRWYARAADGTPSFILDPYGRLTAESVWDVPGILYGTVAAENGTTPYLLWGQWVLLIPLGILGFFWYRSLARYRSRA
jgi:apolipoprotein N-acyltransferase